MSDVKRGEVLGELGAFSREVIGRPLYGYQLEAARAILGSVRRLTVAMLSMTPSMTPSMMPPMMGGLS